MILMLLRYQPWAARHHLPIFLMITPIIAFAIQKINKYAAYLLLSFTVITSFHYVYNNPGRVLVGKNSILYTNRETLIIKENPDLLFQYSSVIQYIKKHNLRNIGLIIENPEAWEYPFWTLLQKNYSSKFKLEHIQILHSSIAYNAIFNPDIIICLYCNPKGYSEYISKNNKPFFFVLKNENK